MEQVGIALVALTLGLAAGAAVMFRRGSGPAQVPRDTFALVEAKLEAQSAELRRLADSAVGRELAGEQLRTGLDGARRTLEAIQLRDAERQRVDADQREVIKRLSTVLAGGAAKGRAGENVLRDHLSELPPGMLVTDFRVGGRVVEFGSGCGDPAASFTAKDLIESIVPADGQAKRPSPGNSSSTRSTRWPRPTAPPRGRSSGSSPA